AEREPELSETRDPRRQCDPGLVVPEAVPTEILDAVDQRGQRDSGGNRMSECPPSRPASRRHPAKPPMSVTARRRAVKSEFTSEIHLTIFATRTYLHAMRAAHRAVLFDLGGVVVGSPLAA